MVFFFLYYFGFDSIWILLVKSTNSHLMHTNISVAVHVPGFLASSSCCSCAAATAVVVVIYSLLLQWSRTKCVTLKYTHTFTLHGTECTTAELYHAIEEQAVRNHSRSMAVAITVCCVWKRNYERVLLLKAVVLCKALARSLARSLVHFVSLSLCQLLHSMLYGAAENLWTVCIPSVVVRLCGKKHAFRHNSAWDTQLSRFFPKTNHFLPINIRHVKYSPPKWKHPHSERFR